MARENALTTAVRTASVALIQFHEGGKIELTSVKAAPGDKTRLAIVRFLCVT